MDVLVLIDKLDELVQTAKGVPMTDQVRIDREEIWEIIDQMRSTIPEEIKQARWIVKERQEMLAEAKREAERLIGEAREQAEREASQQEVVKLAERQAQELLEQARRQGARDAAGSRGLCRRHPREPRGQPRQVPVRRRARPRAAGHAWSRRPATARPTSTPADAGGSVQEDRVEAPRCSICARCDLRPGDVRREPCGRAPRALTLGGQPYTVEPNTLDASARVPARRTTACT